MVERPDRDRMTDKERNKTATEIAVVMEKGGTGKTATSHALYSGLKLRGYKTLLVDLDAQGDSSKMSGVPQSSHSIYEVLKGTLKIEDVIRHTEQGDVIPSSPLIPNLPNILTETGREYKLREALDEIKDRYDFIIIDTPGDLGLHTISALTTATHVIITAEPDSHSVDDIDDTFKTIKTVQKYTNKDLVIAGVLVTSWDARPTINRICADLLREKARDNKTIVFETMIRHSSSIREAQATHVPIFIHNPKSNGAKDYNSFIDELLEAID